MFTAICIEELIYSNEENSMLFIKVDLCRTSHYDILTDTTVSASDLTFLVFTDCLSEE
jgi:hypothetical protein